MKSLSTLSYALLGLIGREPRTAYELMKVFAETKLGGYSSSPGAIYPATAKLRRAGLIEELNTSGPAARRGQTFMLSDAGAAALDGWLTAPVTAADAAHHFGDLMLRFVFMGDRVDDAGHRAFLNEIIAHLRVEIAALDAVEDSMRAGDTVRNDLLAVRAGNLTYAAHLAWAETALLEINS